METFLNTNETNIKTEMYKICNREKHKIEHFTDLNKKEEGKDEGKEEEGKEEESNIVTALKQGKKVELRQDVQDEREGEIEGDEMRVHHRQMLQVVADSCRYRCHEQRSYSHKAQGV